MKIKVLVEFDITNGTIPTSKGSKPHKFELNPELVTRRLMRRLVNADVTELWLDYNDPTIKRKVPFIATMKEFTAVEDLRER